MSVGFKEQRRIARERELIEREAAKLQAVPAELENMDLHQLRNKSGVSSEKFPAWLAENFSIEWLRMRLRASTQLGVPTEHQLRNLETYRRAFELAQEAA